MIFSDFGMDTASLAGALEVKLAAVRRAGFAQVMIAASDVVVGFPCVPLMTSITSRASSGPRRATVACSGSPSGPDSGCSITRVVAPATSQAAMNFACASGTVCENRSSGPLMIRRRRSR